MLHSGKADLLLKAGSSHHWFTTGRELAHVFVIAVKLLAHTGFTAGAVYTNTSDTAVKHVSSFNVPAMSKACLNG